MHPPVWPCLRSQIFTSISDGNCSIIFLLAVSIPHFLCTLHIFIANCCIEEWNWKEQMQNIGSEEIQVDNSNKSNWTASLQKGGQTGGGVSGGSPEIMCEENFYQIGSNLVSTHRRFQWYPILPAPIFLWLWKWPSKLKSHFFRGSFSRLTFQVRRGPCLVFSTIAFNFNVTLKPPHIYML